MKGPQRYLGQELELFRAAQQWKRYLRDWTRPAISGSVLEVGAGLGATTRALCGGAARAWLALEPDPELAEAARASFARDPLPLQPELVCGTLEALPPERRFDTILYVDVLEHIADDAGELRRAAGHLRAGGALIALCPAYPWLYSEFDRALGHHRRYSARALRALSPPGLRLARLEHLDACGLLASLGNKLLLRRALPTRAQVWVWDRLLVRASQRLDPWLGRRVGKTLAAEWRADRAAPGGPQSA